ncbi:MAG: choice-of-anchor I family protein [Polyangiales bacterium]
MASTSDFALGKLCVGCFLVATAACQHVESTDAPELAVTAAPLTAEAARSCGRLALEPLGSYRTGQFDEGAAEIVVHDQAQQRLYVVNAAAAKVDVLDITDPSAPTLLDQVDLAEYGGAVTSVAVRDGVLAAAVPAEERTEPGHVVFLKAEDHQVLASVEVGALPDMLTFTPDGRYVLVANEGEPSDDYTVDPEGSVSVIDLRRGAARVKQRDVRTASFTGCDLAALDPSVRVFGPGATPAQDFEPEYITVSADSRKAWVVLQENNAIAEIDVRRAEVIAVHGLGYKDHTKPGQGLDPSDEDGAVQIANWPVLGLYLPDAIASYSVEGQTYLVTANEGDSRDYEGFSEEARVEDLVLDPEVFPNAAALQDPAALGRLKITSTLGDADGDGDYDALYAYGARSFSIRRANGELVFDSGDQLERITARKHPEAFNADNVDSELEGRSDDKGPEPEGVTLGALDGRTYAFIGAERIGSVFAYDVTNPEAPCFAGYANARVFDGDPEADAAGDLAPEGLLVIPAENSPSGEPLLVVANEVSGSTSLYTLRHGRPR